MDDVSLPPWARSPRDFLRKNRKALESDICTNMLPRWIDLIFGVKSRGEAAMEASNLFHPMAYLGPKELKEMDSDEQRFQAELQAVEFGIVPDMLFSQPHPLREDPADPDDCVLPDFGRAVLGENDGSVGPDGESRTGEQAWELLESPSGQSNEEIGKQLERLDSSQGASFRKERTTSLGFGTAETIDMDENQTKSPKTPTTHVGNEEHDPVTPGGKAQSSWVPDLSVPDIDSPVDPSIQNREKIGATRSFERKPCSDEYNYLGSVPGGDGLNRNLPLSGSGDASRGGRRPVGASLNEGNRQENRFDSTKASHFMRTPDAAASDTGWDLNMIEKSKCFHGDAVSGCSLLLASGPDNTSFLATVSLDGSLMVHSFPAEDLQQKDRLDASIRGFTGKLSKFPYIGMSQTATTQSKLSPYRKHTSADPLACLAQTNDGHGGQIIFAGGHDDVVLAYGINSACAVASVYSHRDAVTGLDIIERPSVGSESVLWSESSTHIMVSGSWDATVKVWSVRVESGEAVSINREPLAELFDADSSVGCLSATPIDGGIAISAGCADGSFVVWLCHDDGSKFATASCYSQEFVVSHIVFLYSPWHTAKVMIHKEQARRGSGPCSAVKWIRERSQLYLLTAFSTGKIASFALSNGAMRKISAVSIGVAVSDKMCRRLNHLISILIPLLHL